MELDLMRTLATMAKLDEYADILMRCRKTNVATDRDFQRRFTAYYKIRCPQEWNRWYYEVFELMKSEDGPTIKGILTELDKFSNGARLCLSFASKMLATLNPDMPIWDSYVARALDLEGLPPKETDGRLDAAVALYDDLVKRTGDLARTAIVRREISKFDSLFPRYAVFSSAKKLDLMLWAEGLKLKSGQHRRR